MLLFGAAAPAQAQDAGVGSLHWMAGCWETRRGDALVEEQWNAPRAGMMLGTSRTVDEGTVVEFEFMRIFADADSVVFAAMPKGQPPAEFRGRVDDAQQRVTFANPSHDFPQRIIYRSIGTDSLHARVEGTRNGRTRAFDFAYARAKCPP